MPGLKSQIGCVSKGNETFSVFDEIRGANDQVILEKALGECWILITADKDFGEMVYRQKRQHHGIILIRLEDQRAAAKIAVLKGLLENYADQLADTFVVVTETKGVSREVETLRPKLVSQSIKDSLLCLLQNLKFPPLPES